ncbi:hypothetical protein TNCV_1009891 [Trichonephila clavipes]|nr:hypothetical protein TNCV_1009891 [Trichonephila clavipes]
MRDTNRSHTRFQVKENDADSPGTCFTGETVLTKRRLYYQSFAENSVFEAEVDDVAMQVKEDRSQIIGSTGSRRIAASVDQPRSTVDTILRKVYKSL